MFAHKYGSAFRLLEDPAEGVKDADVVVTAVWNTAAPGTSESESRLRDFAGFQLTGGLLKPQSPDCMVLHCLPAHRGEEISTAVFEAHADETLHRGRKSTARPEGCAGGIAGGKVKYAMKNAAELIVLRRFWRSIRKSNSGTGLPAYRISSL